MTNSNNLTNTSERLFRRLALLTVITIYLLIVAGGIVRSTGSGMGCPDWPKCFGSWVPPTSSSQLPPNYAEIYGAKLKGEVVFNAAKTWTEYINRLAGAFSGLLVFATLLASIRFLKTDRAIFYGSLVAFVLIGVNGWLGAKVVSTELATYMVTLHMLLAIIVVFALLYVMVRSNAEAYSSVSSQIPTTAINNVLYWVIGLSTIQVVFGTQVREAMDEVIVRMGEAGRMYWIERLGLPFYIHRSFSIVVFGVHLLLIYRLRKYSKLDAKLSTWATILAIAVAVEILTGILLSYLSVPAFAQPIHLTVAIVMLGAQFVILLMINAQTFLKNKSANALSYSH